MTHAPPTTLPQLTPLADVAKLLRIPPRRLADRARARQFTHIRIGKERYVTAEQLDLLLKTYEVSPTSVKSAREKALDETRERLARSRSRRPAA
ncbi:hypothetical protein E1258_16820 [Micromonospora sp. KC207]|uniref:hypothetical protein n=1 Tax=Micromonospora sp. KC207 TaxID=2530377 RepID=UPI001049F6BD|nr:hypothetical protein [Micromonospora sp. KC207]TDC59802.1 hypothetical protein E1258_16820 [Micromonospora sp. KC207]